MLQNQTIKRNRKRRIRAWMRSAINKTTRQDKQ